MCLSLSKTVYNLFSREKVSTQYLNGNVLMTGFGPFQGIKDNPSWNGVKAMMNTEEIENKYNIILAKKLILVEYAHVDWIVPELWSNLQPKLTIHVGVHSEISCFRLEKEARTYASAYYLPDNNNEYVNYQNMVSFRHRTNKCVLHTGLNVETICDEFNNKPPGDGLQAEVSTDGAGRFLCEYIYYTSLCQGTNTLFVHVPVTYTTKQLAQGLEHILELSLKQIITTNITDTKLYHYLDSDYNKYYEYEIVS